DASDKLLSFASERLKVDPDELQIQDGQIVVRSDPGQRMSIAQAAHAATTSAAGAIIGTSAAVREREIQQHGKEQTEIVDAPSTSCVAAQVEVDTETGVVKVLNYFLAQDVGRAINPLACQGQLEGGIAFGLGYA